MRYLFVLLSKSQGFVLANSLQLILDTLRQVLEPWRLRQLRFNFIWQTFQQVMDLLLFLSVGNSEV